jgi:large subunit ribosomal protein L23
MSRRGFGRFGRGADAEGASGTTGSATQLAREERRYSVLLEPHITEKVTNLGETSNQIAFKVAGDATKVEIRRAVETLFDVKVANVTTVNVKGKVKRTLRNSKTKLKNWKKAYVRLQEGENVDYTALEK